MACFFAYGLDGVFDLSKARLYLDALKEHMPREKWRPYHPEYFHTEAFVEHAEYKALCRSASATPEQRQLKLCHALREIDKAYALFPQSEEYQSLREELYAEAASILSAEDLGRIRGSLEVNPLDLDVSSAQ